MIRQLPRRLETLYVPQAVIDAARQMLEPHRRSRTEGCVLWYGLVASDDTAVVTTCVYPRQTAHDRRYRISAEGVREARLATREHDLMLLMQIHTHPQDAFFSDWDKQHPLNREPGALNMVVPDYGAADWRTWRRFCIVECDDHGEWVEWTAQDWRRLRVIPTGVDLMAR